MRGGGVGPRGAAAPRRQGSAGTDRVRLHGRGGADRGGRQGRQERGARRRALRGRRPAGGCALRRRGGSRPSESLPGALASSALLSLPIHPVHGLTSQRTALGQTRLSHGERGRSPASGPPSRRDRGWGDGNGSAIRDVRAPEGLSAMVWIGRVPPEDVPSTGRLRGVARLLRLRRTGCRHAASVARRSREACRARPARTSFRIDGRIRARVRPWGPGARRRPRSEPPANALRTCTTRAARRPHERRGGARAGDP